MSKPLRKRQSFLFSPDTISLSVYHVRGLANPQELCISIFLTEFDVPIADSCSTYIPSLRMQTLVHFTIPRDRLDMIVKGERCIGEVQKVALCTQMNKRIALHLTRHFSHANIKYLACKYQSREAMESDILDEKFTPFKRSSLNYQIQVNIIIWRQY